MKKIIFALGILMLVLALSVPVMAASGEDGPDVLFPFTVVLTDAEGNELEGEFEYTGTKTGTIKSGDTVWLGDEDYIDVLGLPEGTLYAVTEGETEGYGLHSQTDASGVIKEDDLSHARFVNEKLPPEPVFTAEMPFTGGPGPAAIYAVGLLLMAAGAAMAAAGRKHA